METSIIFHKVSEWSKDRIWKYDRWGYQSDKEKKKAEMKTLIRLGKVVGNKNGGGGEREWKGADCRWANNEGR